MGSLNAVWSIEVAKRRRRKMGDVVLLDGSAGFSVESGEYRIVGRDEPDACFLCFQPDCHEWPTLERLDMQENGTGERAFHVPECAMSDIPAALAKDAGDT